MIDKCVRLSSISIWNFKNVAHGKVDLINNHKNYRTSILGLYGQNGSGKTALIDAIQLLKYVLCGQKIPARFADFISVDAENARFQFSFTVRSDMESYDAVLEFFLKKESDTAVQNMNMPDQTENQYRAVIYNEILSCSYQGNGIKERKSQLIDTRTEKVFAPASKYNCLVGKDKKRQRI